MFREQTIKVQCRYARKGWYELIDVTVMECVPQLPNLQELVSKLNEHRDFYVFLKEMRQAFVDLVKRF